MDAEQGDGRLLVTFEKYHEFAALQEQMLHSCSLKTQDAQDQAILLKLSIILDEYQEQSYLLDPFLERLVDPVVEQLKNLVRNPTPNAFKDSIRYLSILLYHYVKFRGYKSITQFFPHEVADLSDALNFLLLPDGPAQDPSQWALRYIMLLWLSLICMLPFDLAQFDEPEGIGKTASDLENVAKANLGKAGLERDGAAIMLARLYARKDMSTRFLDFLRWCEQLLENPTDPIPCIGVFHVLSELAKTGSVALIESSLSTLFRLTSRVEAVNILANCTLLRKYRVKLSSRILLRLLPIRIRRSRARALLPKPDDNSVGQLEENDVDVPEEAEDVLQDLFRALQDKDTIVRYSSAKAVARIAERLPVEFAEQVLDQVLQLFSIHSMGAASLYDMPSIAEGTWHGACLACAEMARRGLIPGGRLGELLDWMKKALYFDIRRGANSVGSSVRDAASYVLWSVARAQSVDAIAPFAIKLAQTLVTVAVFDREVHIRRAASAAFQEFVGRTSLFPCGIDVLRKTDFYAVGTRRHAFMVAAVEVAEHAEYRSGLLEHLLTITLRHWDPAMRRLGAQSLRKICEFDLSVLGLTCADRVAEYLTFPDAGDVHGALLALSELAAAFEQKPADIEMSAKRKIFLYLSKVPSNLVLSRRYELITVAACELIAHGISSAEAGSSDGPSVTQWHDIIDFGLQSSSVAVQEAAADAMSAGRRGSPPMQQSVCRVLGVLDYDSHPHGILQAISFLVESVDYSAPTGLKNVEARRNAYSSLPQILSTVVANLNKQLSSQAVNRMLDSLLAGLEDYTMDERGDVGSWIRIACVKGLASFAEILISHAPSLPGFAEYLPAAKYHELLAGILKQGVERLDNVRQQAGEQFIRLLQLPLPRVGGAEAWRVHGDQLMNELFFSGSDSPGWNEGSWLFPKVVQLLAIKEYRRPLLRGLTLSASTKTDSTQRPVSASLISYGRTLPVRSADGHYDLHSLASDLLAEAKVNLTSNNIVVPVLQCFNFLLENDVFEELTSDTDGLTRLEALLGIASRNISRMKNVHRIDMSMRIVVNMICLPELRGASIKQLPNFLAHQYPKIRANTAEFLYLILQSKDVGCDTEEVENVILETEWSSSDMALVNEAAQLCVRLLCEAGES